MEYPDFAAPAAAPAPHLLPAAAGRLQGQPGLTRSRRGEGLRPWRVGVADPTCGTDPAPLACPIQRAAIGSGGPLSSGEILDMGRAFVVAK